MIYHRLKLLLFTVICVVTTIQAAASAEMPQEMPQELIDCRNMASAVARLDCYDLAVDTHKGSTGEPLKERAAQAATPAATAVTAPTADKSVDAISPEALFGKNVVEMQESVQKATGTEELTEIHSFVSKVRSTATGKAVITLDNGQVWMQIDNARLRLSGYDKISIRRASLGSYLLYKSGSKTSMRVKRIS